MATQYSYGKPKYTSGIAGSQEKWANDYTRVSNPDSIGQYLDYTKSLGLSNINKTYGSGKNLQAAQKDMFNKYSNAIKTGTNNLSQLNDYLGYAKAFGFQVAKPSDQVMREISIAALNGSVGAQNYLKAMNLKPVSGNALWNNIDTSKLDTKSAAYQQYIKDQPFSATAKSKDDWTYNQYNNLIAQGKQLDNNQMKLYSDLIAKWNLADKRDPFVQQQDQLNADKNAALSAQDVALNQGLVQADANSFNQYQQLQQQMADKGMGASGVAADAYMRAQMAANQDYQQAYSDAASNKADIQSQFNSDISQSKLEQKQYQDSLDAQTQQLLIDAQKNQTDQDKYLTEATGYVYLNGKLLTDTSGNPVGSMAMQKLQETSRHNQASESIQTQKIAADINIAAQKMSYNWASLDLKSQQVQADMDNAAAKLDLAARNADTAEMRARATVLSNQMKNIQSQVNAYIKNGKKVPDSLKKQLKDLQSQMSALASMGK